MQDGFKRNINYLRISVTDRCNLRCVYCMPEDGVEWAPHEQIVSYEELLRICRIFATLGVSKIKITGGEPLVRKDLANFISVLKKIEGIQSVSITTNGLLLPTYLDDLVAAGVDAVNISLDTLDRGEFLRITRYDLLDKVLEAIEKALTAEKLTVKLNCVLLGENDDQILPLVRLAEKTRLMVRFIEMMPIGLGGGYPLRTEQEVLAVLEPALGKFTPCRKALGNGPCHYYEVPNFVGNVGFISAMSHSFCSSCNRVRLTSDGCLKTCLQYDETVNLRAHMSEDDEVLTRIIVDAINAKPKEHDFLNKKQNHHAEQRMMSQIGG